MNIKTDEGESFAITITRNWNGVLELWVKKKYKKFASVVANHLPAWLCKSHGSLVLPLLSAEHQKIAVDTTWVGNTPFKQVDIDTQEIIDTEINWLIDCDNISLGTTGSNFIAAEDDLSIGSFKSTTSRVSFKSIPEVCTFVSEQNSNSVSKETASVSKATSLSGHAAKHNITHDATTIMLESAKGSEIPLAPG